MKEQLTEELFYTTRLIENKLSKYTFFSKYCPVYLFTTENIKGMLDTIDFEGKELLLTCSSGDHILNALLKNPKKIVAFDINALTKHVFELKKAAILTLEQQEFIDFFYVSNYNITNKPFNKKTYDRIKKFLPQQSRIYWDYIFENYKSSQIRSSSFIKYCNCTYQKKTIQGINPYLQGNNYQILREKLKDFELEFINSSITELPQKLTTKFDYIYLSNIADYLTSKKDRLADLKELVQRLSKNSKDNGEIGIVYIYNYQDGYFEVSKNRLYNPYVRRKYFSETEYSYVEFPSPMVQLPNTTMKNVRPQDKDAILTLSLKKKITNS